MAKKTVKEHIKAEILQRVTNGEKIYKLSEEFGLSIQAIYMWVRDAKGSKTKDIITNRKPTFKPITEKEIAKLSKDRDIMLDYNKFRSNYWDK